MEQDQINSMFIKKKIKKIKEKNYLWESILGHWGGEIYSNLDSGYGNDSGKGTSNSYKIDQQTQTYDGNLKGEGVG
jgi:hypothetical protein